MKLLATLALLMCSTAAVSAPLSKEEAAFVIVTVGMIRVSVECGYEDDIAALDKLGDANGVDGPALRKAVAEALLVRSGNDYDRAKLIPEVTRVFNEAWRDATLAINKDRRGFCKKLGGALINKGLMRRKP